MIKSYIDNSILSELREKDKKRHKLIFDTCKKHSILAKNCIVTDKLFIELIYQGHVRRLIVNEHKNEIDGAQNKILKLSSNDNIKESINFIEMFFDTQLRKALSIKIINEITIETLQNNPIAYRFRMFKKMILRYANDIINNNKRYDEFIMNLVVDSVVRYALLDIAAKIDDDLLVKIMSALMIRYKDSMHSILLGYSAAAQIRSKVKLKKKDQGQLLRAKDDFADMELPFFAFYGEKINDKHYPVTCLTREPLNKIQKRIDYYFSLIVKIANESPSFNRPPLLGKTLIIDFDQYICKEIESGSSLKNIKQSSYVLYPSQLSTKIKI